MSVERFGRFISFGMTPGLEYSQVKDEVAALLGISPESDNIMAPSSVTLHTDKVVFSVVADQPERSEPYPAEVGSLVHRFS